MKKSKAKQCAAMKKAEREFPKKMMKAMRDHAIRHEIEGAVQDALALQECGRRVGNRLLPFTKPDGHTIRRQSKDERRALRLLVKAVLDTAMQLTNTARALADNTPDMVKPVARRLSLWPELVRLSGKTVEPEHIIAPRLKGVGLGSAFPWRAVGSKSRSKLYALLCALHFGGGVEVRRKIVIERIVEHGLDGRKHTRRATDEDNQEATKKYPDIRLVAWTKRDGTPCKPPAITAATLPEFIARTMRLFDGPYGPQLIERVYGPVPKNQKGMERSDIKREIRRVLEGMITGATGKE